MSELIAISQTSNRLQFLSTVSAVSLLLAISTNAKADDVGRPTVWIEVGGQLSRLENKQELYSPPFLALEPVQFDSPLPSMKPTGYEMEADGAISIQPQNSNWSFSASVRYSRSGKNKNFHQQSYPLAQPREGLNGSFVLVPAFAAQQIDANFEDNESHSILDFQAGRDVGVGTFGHDGTSSLSLGVRIAQFSSRSNASFNEDPDWHFIVKTLFKIGTHVLQGVNQPYHTYYGKIEAERSFRGIGPSLSWKSSTPFAGNVHDGALTLDWGVNAALLFGRQRTRTEHYETAQYHAINGLVGDNPGRTTLYHHPTDAPAYYSTRSRNVTVPNIGGFAGMSFRYDNAKVSFGYRADFFFGAIDGGIDSRKTYDRNFYGPFANISIGLGG